MEACRQTEIIRDAIHTKQIEFMQYDPIKRSLGNIFNKTPFLRKVFYGLLDLLLLRSWHVHKELRGWIKNSKSDASILDAGAGFGQYTYWLSRKNPNWSIIAMDVKDEQVADCNRFFQQIGAKNVKFEVGDLTNFTHPNKYDLVVCVDVMEHILEDVQVFKNYVASMKPGAMLLISTPSDQGGSDVHWRGARDERGPAGAAIRWCGREIPGRAPGCGGPAAGRGVHLQCAEMPPAREPGSAAGRDRGLRGVPGAANRYGRPAGDRDTGAILDVAVVSPASNFAYSRKCARV